MLFILAWSIFLDLFFAYITHRCISLSIFLSTDSDYDFYLDLRFCEGFRLLIVFSHWLCYMFYRLF